LSEVRTGFEPAYNGFANSGDPARQSAPACESRKSCPTGNEPGAPESERGASGCKPQYGFGVPDTAERRALTDADATALVEGALASLDTGNLGACRALLLMFLGRAKG
jgi:hypothetical protein